MKNNKGFAPILLVIAIMAVLAIGGGAYYLDKSSNTSLDNNHLQENQNVDSVVVQDSAFKDKKLTTISPTTTVSPSNTLSLKEVRINDIYFIKVPSDFSITQISHNITNVPNYEFIESNYQNRFRVIVHPILRSNSPIDGKCSISPGFTKAYCEGATLINSFTTPSGRKVFYGTISDDLTQSCTANSICPPPPDNQRYSITYIFIINDIDNTLVEFFAGDAVRKPSPEVNDFEGVAKLLHDTVIPSFRTNGGD